MITTVSKKPSIRQIPFSNLQKLHQELDTSLQAAFSRVLHSGWFILGEELAKFETDFANYLGVKHCIGVGNGLDALVLILKALNIGSGDEVIVPTHTFIATWLAVTQVGARVVPVSTDEYFTLDAKQLAMKINANTKAIIPVHLYGHPADMDAITSVIKDRPIFVIEDAAQAHGAKYKNKKAGNLGFAGAFSFYPGKNLGALGDGGGITTNDDALAQQLRVLRNYGSNEKYNHEFRGVNTRLDELQAAFLNEKLRYLDQWNTKKDKLAQHYLQELSQCDFIKLPKVASWAEPVWHQFVVRSERRDDLRNYLKNHGIQTLIHYPIANHVQGAYQEYFSDVTYPAYEQESAEILSLPICPTLEIDDIDYVCRVIKAFN